MYRTETPRTTPRPTARRATTTDVIDADGIVTSAPDSPRSIRAARGAMPRDPRTVNGPVVTRIATPEEIARMAPKGKPSPFSS